MIKNQLKINWTDRHNAKKKLCYLFYEAKKKILKNIDKSIDTLTLHCKTCRNALKWKSRTNTCVLYWTQGFAKTLLLFFLYLYLWWWHKNHSFEHNRVNYESDNCRHWALYSRSKALTIIFCMRWAAAGAAAAPYFVYHSFSLYCYSSSSFGTDVSRYFFSASSSHTAHTCKCMCVIRYVTAFYPIEFVQYSNCMIQ